LPADQQRGATNEITGAATRLNESNHLFYPMTEFYKEAGVSLPAVARVEGPDVPEPYRSLLVHNRDMTPTLATAYRRKMNLRVFKKILTDNIFARQIVLEPEGDDRVAVFAAIKIYLDHFSPDAKRLILEAKQPFGTILHEQQIAHCSRPEAFISVAADETIGKAMGLNANPVLYGRRSALWNSSQIPLAQVLEILPPMES
jgi:chorismate-pyruvate lyase